MISRKAYLIPIFFVSLLIVGPLQAHCQSNSLEKLGPFAEELMNYMIDDAFIENEDDTYSFIFEKGTISINGKTLKGTVLKRYSDLVAEHYGKGYSETIRLLSSGDNKSEPKNKTDFNRQDEFLKNVRIEMVKDGYIKTVDSKYDLLIFSKDKIEIEGKKLNGEEFKKYRAILIQFYGKDFDQTLRFRRN